METEHLVLRTASSSSGAVAMRTRSSKNRSAGAAGADKATAVSSTTATMSSVTTTTAIAAGDGTSASMTTTTTTTTKTVRSTRRERAELHTFERLHQEGFAYLADNSYIRSGYRLNYSVRDCFLSLFELHNETLNVWTHMIGSIIFVLLMAYLALSSSALGPVGNGASNGNGSNDRFVPAPAWCGAPQDAYVQRGRHTPRLFLATALPEYCPRAHSVRVLPEQKQKYYEVASVIFEHSLHQIPSLERFHDILERNLGDIAASLAVQTGQLKAELVELKDRLSHVTDYEQVRLVKANVNARAEDLSTFLHSLASHVGADLTLKYAVDELHGLADSVKNGLHILATVDTHDVPHWPIFVFMVSAVICLTCSATFHLLFVHSKPAYFLLSRLDYAGITILIAGSFYPLIYYAFYCQPWAQRLYLTAITVMAGLTFVVTLTPTFSTPKFLLFRTCLFLALGFFGIVPVSHLVWHHGLFDPHVTVMIGPLALMALLYTLGAVIYATRFPERFYPGRFDVWCSSHQLWHVCVVAAALVHFVNALQHYQWRWNTTCDA